MIIAIDFDGTIVRHCFPEIGEEVLRAFEWMKRFQELGAKLILYTMRSDGCEDGGNYLQDAVEYCCKMGVGFWAHNDNPQQKEWTSSRKVYAHVYIDDAAAGCPLRPHPNNIASMVVDWDVIGPYVESLLLAKAKP